MALVSVLHKAGTDPKEKACLFGKKRSTFCVHVLESMDAITTTSCKKVAFRDNEIAKKRCLATDKRNFEPFKYLMAPPFLGFRASLN